ncbi:MAG: OmpA family protein [Alphaproteobacteria bacterium]|nr:OmpA family protein [Alphaproteobacteria bacterium]
MRGIKTFLQSLFICAMSACAPYRSPERYTWMQYLNGASFTDMTEMSRIAKRPVYLGAGGQLINSATDAPDALEYGDKVANDNAIATQYMAKLEFALYDALRKPGISVQRAGTDVVVILVRDALMELNVPEISETGADTLDIISKILKKYNATFIEVAGYTDAMRDSNAAGALSMDMAQRVSVYFAQHGINTTRLFIVGRGAARPIAAQDNIGRLTNRRVEIRLTPAR